MDLRAKNSKRLRGDYALREDGDHAGYMANAETCGSYGKAKDQDEWTLVVSKRPPSYSA
jgi:hypothetical protein